MLVTQPGLASSTAVPALVAAQTDRAGETQALLPELEAITAGAANSTDLNGADVPSSGGEQALKPNEPLDPVQPIDPPSPEQSQPPEQPQLSGLSEPTPPVLEASPTPPSAVIAASVEPAVIPKPQPVEETAPSASTQSTLSTPDLSGLDQPPGAAISAAEIFASRNAEMANLAARIEERSQAYASRARRRAISTATREYIYANYMEAWRRKVERIGNLNYPREARELGLFGSLILHVAVRADGSLEGIRVVRSSGHEVLDQAAIRIVELAAPFAPFPPNIKRETDVLDITRTWQFQRNNELGWGH
ncbi:MAG: energy transducer TonB [Halochromatium sp.]|nr:energy transducer TonB [Halochromatium sp.]